MSATLARTILSIAGIYLALGAAFAIPFVAFGVGRIDPGARSASWGFRLLIFPGSVAFWPLLARRWLSGQGEPPEERNAHRSAARRDAGT